MLRIEPDGKPFVLLDSPFQEIRALRFDDKGMLYVAAISGRAGAGAAPVVDRHRRRSRPSERSARADCVGVGRDHVDVDRRRRRLRIAERRRARIARAPKGAVYRIAADGVWDQLWESRDDSPYDLTFDADGALIIGTGGKGKLYRLEGDPLRPTLLARARRSR